MQVADARKGRQHLIGSHWSCRSAVANCLLTLSVCDQDGGGSN